MRNYHLGNHCSSLKLFTTSHNSGFYQMLGVSMQVIICLWFFHMQVHQSLGIAQCAAHYYRAILSLKKKKLNILLFLAASVLSRGMRALLLRCTGSVIVACRLSFPRACGILASRRGIKPESLVLEDEFLASGPPEKSWTILYYFFLSLSLINCGRLIQGKPWTLTST